MVKVFFKKAMSPEPLNLWTDVRHWSAVLCCTILTHFSDLEIKVTENIFHLNAPIMHVLSAGKLNFADTINPCHAE